MKRAAFFSALTYLLTYFAMGVYTQPAGPSGPVFWLGFPVACIASVTVAHIGVHRAVSGEWE